MTGPNKKKCSECLFECENGHSHTCSKYVKPTASFIKKTRNTMMKLKKVNIK